MKLVNRFSDFLRDTVNLNQTRLDFLEGSAEAIEEFIREAEWEPRIWKFERQGSWAAKTIIKPVEGAEYDADLLAIIAPVDGWEAKDYVKSLYDVFSASGRYGDKVQLYDYCVTIVYAGMRRIDIAPCVRGREVADRHEVCDRSANEFVPSEPTAFTEWLKERNSHSGNDSFRKVTRLVKYLRDITSRFECPSVLLTTLLGNQMQWNDKEFAGFEDVPSALKTLFVRLDTYLQAQPIRPTVANPSLNGEDFGELISQAQYDTLRDVIHQLCSDIEEAYEKSGFYDSVLAWRQVFGDGFAKGVTVAHKAESADLTENVEAGRALLVASAHHDDSLADKIVSFGRWIWSPDFDRPPHIRPPIWKVAENISDNVQVLARWHPSEHSPEGSSRQVRDFEELPADGGLWFDVRVNGGEQVPIGHIVRWRITNTGRMAMAMGAGRGGFESPQLGHKRWERLSYKGVHLAEAFIIRSADSQLVGQSSAFHVLIR